MKAPVLVFRNPNGPRVPPQLPRVAQKAALLANRAPDIVDIVEKLIDDLLVDVAEYERGGAR